jgi:sucrose-6-phosphatase
MAQPRLIDAMGGAQAESQRLQPAARAEAASGGIKLFCSDLDGTLLGNPEATRRFKDTWEGMLRARRPLLCYASGRLVQDVIDLLAGNLLPWPDYIVGGVGTQVYDGRQRRMVREYAQAMSGSWDLSKIEELMTGMPGVEPQPARLSHSHKSSWYFRQASAEAIDHVRQTLSEAGLDANVVYSSMRDLDILPSRANKGFALRWLSARLGIALDEVLVAGDTGNDSSMFLLPGVKGIVVENAQPELLEAVVKLPTYTAGSGFADGVLEGLKHFLVIPDTPNLASTTIRGHETDPTLRMLFMDAAVGSLTTEERRLIGEGYAQALAALRKTITPLGFTACSMEDNEITGTDANYRSVWARDGAIAIYCTIGLRHVDIVAAQKQTLRTLFDNIAANGIVPARVKVEDGSPDYSGVGGICAVDSGLWAIIAFYTFVNQTEDHEFLAEYADRLARAMTWLGALDSNNDGLLEIPEAGDWTDLFGHSYHVLYDEVLWYRANVCYGRLLEFQRRFDEAAEYLRRSQHLRDRILAFFWPTTRRREASASFTFADRQFTIGDTSYLLAELTPFGFSWRCDVLGNVLAFLFNILDVDHARTAFRFLWGVGANEPWPIANLYPPVQAGDPDWRPYYTVNLLNLPWHYHNGGIWPFIGGMWVRFVNRLGLYEVACRELVRLAQLNRLGRSQEWEFNEWVHGRTGKPMGKAFQTWSAASFIFACRELEVGPESRQDE